MTNETEAFREKLVSVTLFHHKSHMNWPGNETVLPCWQNITYAILTSMH